MSNLPKTKLIHEIIADQNATILGKADIAPSDGKQYAMKDGAWEEVVTMRGVAVFVSATEPTEQQTNDIWIKI